MGEAMRGLSGPVASSGGASGIGGPRRTVQGNSGRNVSDAEEFIQALINTAPEPERHLLWPNGRIDEMGVGRG